MDGCMGGHPSPNYGRENPVILWAVPAGGMEVRLRGASVADVLINNPMREALGRSPVDDGNGEGMGIPTPGQVYQVRGYSGGNDLRKAPIGVTDNGRQPRQLSGRSSGIFRPQHHGGNHCRGVPVDIRGVRTGGDVHDQSPTLDIMLGRGQCRTPIYIFVDHWVASKQPPTMGGVSCSDRKQTDWYV